MHPETVMDQAIRTPKAPNRTGQITMINNDGLAFLMDPSSGQQYAFTFDKIQGYYGHTAREIGLTVGTHVHFEISGGEISCVQLPQLAVPKLLTVPEVAGLLRVSERLVYNMIKRRELAHVRLGRLMRIPAEAVKSLVAPGG